MTEKIIILNVLLYPNKETGEPNTRLEFMFANPDKSQKTEKFKGKPTLALYYKNATPFEKITPQILENVVEAKFKAISNLFNPLKTSSIIESIVFKDNVIDLL